MEWIYFDHAASTPMTEKSLSVLLAAHQKGFANPAAAHAMGRDIADRLNACRTVILNSIEADPAIYQVVFTGSATEANNLVIQSFSHHEGTNPAAESSLKSNSVTAIGSAGDHPSLVQPIQQLKSHALVGSVNRPSSVELADGLIENCQKHHPALLAVTHVNSQSGQILPLDRVVSKVRSHCQHIHIDASQSYTKIPLSLKTLDLDSVSLSAHKMGGPKGVAALVVKKENSLRPLFFGGGHEFNLRSSTVAAPLCFSWAQAIKDQQAHQAKTFQTISAFNDLIRHRFADEKVASFPFRKEETSPFILTLVLDGLPSDLVLRQLEEEKIIAASTTACSSKNKKADPTFLALGIAPQDHSSVLRLSFCSSTTKAEIELLIQTLVRVVTDLKKLTGPASCTRLS